MRNFANALMEHAHEARASGQMSLDDYFVVADRYQTIINQANEACYKANTQVAPMSAQLEPIEQATKTLEQSATFLAKTTNILAISGDLAQAVTALVLGIVKGEPSELTVVGTAIVNAVQGIRGEASR